MAAAYSVASRTRALACTVSMLSRCSWSSSPTRKLPGPGVGLSRAASSAASLMGQVRGSGSRAQGTGFRFQDPGPGGRYGGQGSSGSRAQGPGSGFQDPGPGGRYGGQGSGARVQGPESRSQGAAEGRWLEQWAVGPGLKSRPGRVHGDPGFRRVHKDWGPRVHAWVGIWQIHTWAPRP